MFKTRDSQAKGLIIFSCNLILITLSAALAVKLYAVWDRPLEIPDGKTNQGRERTIHNSGLQGRANETSFDVITSKNIFRPSRSSGKKEAVASRRGARDDVPQLFGTVILGDKKLAILEDMSTKKSGMYEVNDAVAGFVVADIQKEKIVLKKGTESILVGLRDDKKFTPPKRIQKPPKTIRKPLAKRRRPQKRGRPLTRARISR